MNFAHCLQIAFIIGKCKTIFFLGGGLRLGLISMGRTFLKEENFCGVNIPGEMLQWGFLTKLLHEILFNCLTFSLPNF